MDGSGGPDPANPHPDKKVPALVHDDHLITQSVAMAPVPDRPVPGGVHRGPRVGDPLRGSYLTWLAYYAGVMEPVVNLEFSGLFEHAGMQRTFTSRAAVDRRVSAALHAGPYLLGEHSRRLTSSLPAWASGRARCCRRARGSMSIWASAPPVRRRRAPWPRTAAERQHPRAPRDPW